MENTLKLWLNEVGEPNNTARRLMQIYSNTPCVIDCLAEGEDDDEDECDLLPDHPFHHGRYCSTPVKAKI